MGYDEIPVYIVNLKDLAKGEVDENIKRKNFAPSEMVAIWLAMEKYDKWHQPSESDGGKERRKRASKILGISTDTLSKAKQIIDYAKKLDIHLNTIAKIITTHKNSIDRKIMELYLRAWNTQESISDILDIPQQTISRVIETFTQKPKIREMGKSLEPYIYNIWNLKSADKETSHFGHFPWKIKKPSK
ncbi:hypothetical protein ES695_12540 [Candidatus Atribacteria bacterium 1244-E10-H5-B2]|nr:MAG: hypothetical protein ES695_12540 [Candidatus Atribacteria bacterium 1244-E10-H5-B2]